MITVAKVGNVTESREESETDPTNGPRYVVDCPSVHGFRTEPLLSGDPTQWMRMHPRNWPSRGEERAYILRLLLAIEEDKQLTLCNDCGQQAKIS
jgi:hypothetical protein